MNPLQVPQQDPYGERGLFTGHFAYLSKTSFFRFPSKEALAERCPTTRALLQSSIKVPGIRALPHIPGSPWMERGPHGERCLYLETFLTYLPGFPVKELPPEAPTTEPLQRKTLHPQSPLHSYLKVPGR
jgi:hypothetical protein